MKQIMLLMITGTLLLYSCGQNQQSASENNNTNAAATPADNGKQLFMSNCAQCHSINQDKMGPKLSGVLGRWNGDTTQLVAFIKNSQSVISSGNNQYAAKLFHTWSEATMPAFPNLSDKDVKDILAYINKGVD
jgi:cytochrome c2